MELGYQLWQAYAKPRSQFFSEIYRKCGDLPQVGNALPVDGLINLLRAKCGLACSESLFKIRKFKPYNGLHYFSLYHAPGREER